MTSTGVTIDDVRAAAAQIRAAVPPTPCAHSRTLSALTGAHVVVKFENLQFTASFKDRGALNKLLSLDATERKAGVIAMSAGNHAQGVAYHAGRLGIAATIVMPAATPNVKVRQTRSHGAEVVLVGETLEASAEAARKIAAERGLVFIHPYDDPKIVAGQGTVGLEMLDAFPDLEVLLVPIGGGGLIAGIATVAKALKPAIRIVGVEAALYPSMHAALTGAKPAIGGNTLAEGIAVKAVGALPLAILRGLVEDVILVDEPAIERAVQLYLDIEKTVAEGAGAASLAALLANPERFKGRKVGLVLSGGNIDPRLLASVIMRGMVRDGRILRIRVEIDDKPGTLARVAALVGEVGGNIIDVAHQRLFSDVPAKSAELDLVVETRDGEHGRELIGKIRAAGYAVRELASTAAGGS